MSEIAIVHVLRTGEPICPKCGQGLEEEGGSVVRGGSWDYGPLWWECLDCPGDNYPGLGETYKWGFA